MEIMKRAPYNRSPDPRMLYMLLLNLVMLYTWVTVLDSDSLTRFWMSIHF
jgi:hypothetical protein